MATLPPLPFLTQLPSELIEMIISYLELPDLLSLATFNKAISPIVIFRRNNTVLKYLVKPTSARAYDPCLQEVRNLTVNLSGIGAYAPHSITAELRVVDARKLKTRPGVGVVR